MRVYTQILIIQIRNLEVDGCPSTENLSGQSALLINATYIVFPWGDLQIPGIIITSGINSYNFVITLNELIT